jgi:inner membrane protein
MLVGAALSVALLKPMSATALLIDIAGGFLGGWICDVDVNTKTDAKDHFFGVDIILPLCVIAFIDRFWSLGIIDHILLRLGPESALGISCFVALLVLGSQWKVLCRHRTFMHSLLAVALFSCALWLVFPPLAQSFFVGMVAHILLDMTNKMGVQVLYPLPFKPCLGLFKSDGVADTAIRLCALVVLVYLAQGFLPVNPIVQS